MKDDESIASYNTKIKDISNKSFSLGELMLEEKLVMKILKTLPKKLESKVTSIEEVEDLTKMKIDELIGPLTTYEMKIDDSE
ncbi:hypothetical protein LIER_38817 [Lithospermum erythrorhizon]|uniref:Uncharacterized protein n=1 Tax=Lithospermum erythrorhizon TaxID=34254 RepID=A0AAV3Q626_LITER